MQVMQSALNKSIIVINDQNHALKEVDAFASGWWQEININCKNTYDIF